MTVAATVVAMSPALLCFLIISFPFQDTLYHTSQ